MKKKISKYVALMAVLTINASTVLEVANIVDTVAVAETVGNWQDIIVKEGSITYSVIGSDLGTGFNEKFVAGQRYNLNFVGSGEITIYRSGNAQSEPIVRIVDGSVSNKIFNAITLNSGDYIVVKATEGKGITVSYQAVVDTDYSKLTNKIDEANAIDVSRYTKASVAYLEHEINACNAVLENSYVNQATIDDYVTRVDEKMQALVSLATADEIKTLEDLITDAKSINEKEYTKNTYNKMQEIVEDVDYFLGHYEKTQTEIINFTNELKDAINNLEKIPEPVSVDKSALEKLISKAENYKKDDYTVSSFADLERAIKEAKIIVNKTSATQAQIDEEINYLQKAIDNLIKKNENGNSGDEETENIILVDKIHLSDCYYNHYVVYYDVKNDELVFKPSDLSELLGLEPPVSIENISLKGNTTFKVGEENWELVREGNDFTIKYLDERVIGFDSLDEYASLVGKYHMYRLDDNNRAVRITDDALDFDVDYIDLNTDEGQKYNANEEPKMDFNYDENSYRFNLVLNDVNRLAGLSFKYTYDLPKEFVKSDAYRKLIGQKSYSGYIKRNILNCGGYTNAIMEYQIIDGKLEIKVLSTALAEASKHGEPVEDFNGSNKIEKEIVAPVIKAPVRKVNEKKQVIKEAKEAKKVKGELPKMGGELNQNATVVGVGALMLAIILMYRRKFKI